MRSPRACFGSGGGHKATDLSSFTQYWVLGCPSLCSGPHTHTPTPFPGPPGSQCPDLAASFCRAALCLQAHTHSHSCRTRCYACCTCGHCAGTRMSSTLTRPGGSWTSPLPAQSRSSEPGSHRRGFQSASQGSRMGWECPPVAIDLWGQDCQLRPLSARVDVGPAGRGMARNCGGLLPTVPAPEPPLLLRGCWQRKSTRRTGQTMPRGRGSGPGTPLGTGGGSHWPFPGCSSFITVPLLTCMTEIWK